MKCYWLFWNILDFQRFGHHHSSMFSCCMWKLYIYLYQLDSSMIFCSLHTISSWRQYVLCPMHRCCMIERCLCFWWCFLCISISQSHYRLHYAVDCTSIRSRSFWYSFLNSNICCCSQSVFVNQFWSDGIGYLWRLVGHAVTDSWAWSSQFDFVCSRAMKDLNGMFYTLGDLDHRFTLRFRWKSFLALDSICCSTPRVSFSSDSSSTSPDSGASSSPLYLTWEIDWACCQLSFIFFVWICRWSLQILFSVLVSLNNMYSTFCRNSIISHFNGLLMV